MKTVAVIVCAAAFLALQYVNGSPESDRLIHKECQADPASHLDEDLIKKAGRGEHVDPSLVGPHALCMNVKGGVQSQNGDIIEAGLRSFLNKKIHDSATVDDIVKECGKRNGGSAQESALALTKCLRDHVPGLQFHDHHGGHH